MTSITGCTCQGDIVALMCPMSSSESLHLALPCTLFPPPPVLSPILGRRVREQKSLAQLLGCTEDKGQLPLHLTPP